MNAVTREELQEVIVDIGRAVVDGLTEVRTSHGIPVMLAPAADGTGFEVRIKGVFLASNGFAKRAEEQVQVNPDVTREERNDADLVTERTQTERPHDVTERQQPRTEQVITRYGQTQTVQSEGGGDGTTETLTYTN